MIYAVAVFAPLLGSLVAADQPHEHGVGKPGPGEH